MEYSVDISYYTTDADDDDVDDIEVHEITNKYNDCEWYARDTTFGKGVNTYVSNGYLIKSLETLKKIIKEVNDNPYLWIAFCTKTVGEDIKRIYSSPVVLLDNGKLAKNLYAEQVAQFVGEDKEVYDLCMEGD